MEEEDAGGIVLPFEVWVLVMGYVPTHQIYPLFFVFVFRPRQNDYYTVHVAGWEEVMLGGGGIPV